MSIFHGSTELLAGNITLGNVEVTEVYYGSEKIWPLFDQRCTLRVGTTDSLRVGDTTFLSICENP